jgi:hypothetical protein
VQLRVCRHQWAALSCPHPPLPSLHPHITHPQPTNLQWTPPPPNHGYSRAHLPRPPPQLSACSSGLLSRVLIHLKLSQGLHTHI